MTPAAAAGASGHVSPPRDGEPTVAAAGQLVRIIRLSCRLLAPEYPEVSAALERRAPELAAALVELALARPVSPRKKRTPPGVAGGGAPAIPPKS
jgi:hypothetical protein